MSSLVASSKPSLKFSLMVVAKRTGSCPTQPIWFLSQVRSSSRRSVPSRRTLPSSGSQNRMMSWRMVDLPQPDSPTSAVLLTWNSMERFFRMSFFLSFGQAKLTFQNFMLPSNFQGRRPFTGFLITGSRSTRAKIRPADCMPSPIFFIAGESCVKLKHPMRTAKKTVMTSPALQSLPLMLVGQCELPGSAQEDPNQQPREQRRNMAEQRKAMLAAILTPKQRVSPLESPRQSWQIFSSWVSPLSCLTVLMEQKACSDSPPAFEQCFWNSEFLLCSAFMQSTPAQAMMGKAARQTSVISQPCTRAITKPATKVPSTWIITAIFSPSAPWKVCVSELKLLLSYDWLMQSNHPISCRSSAAKQALRQAVAWRSPEMSQPVIITHPAKSVPMARQMNFSRIWNADWTICALVSPKTLVKSPQKRMNSGQDPPSPTAPSVPTVIKMQSVLSANLNKLKKDAPLTSSST